MAISQQVCAATSQEQLDALLAQDERLARVAEPILAANASLCRQKMPIVGIVLHSRDQYSTQTSGELFANGPVQIALVLPNSPAERAGLRANDALIAIGSRQTSSLRAEGEAPLRDAAFEAIVAEWREGDPLLISANRGGETIAAELEASPGCRALVEIRTRDSFSARSDGRVIQVDHGLVAAAKDDELAVIVAHELAHVVLEHRKRLEAAGVSKGFFGEFGRNRRLNRQVEIEADRLTIHLLANAGLDPQLAPAFWRSALARRAASGLNLIYPSNSARAEALEEEIENYLPARKGPSTADHLLALRDLPFSR